MPANRCSVLPANVGIAYVLVVVLLGCGAERDVGESSVAHRGRIAGGRPVPAAPPTTTAADAADQHQQTRPNRPPPRLTPAQAAGQRIVFAFHGTKPPSDLLQRIATRRAASVILFARNITSRAGVRALAHRLQAARPNGDPPLLLMVDQEGGHVDRLPGRAAPSAAQLSGRSLDRSYAAGKHAGRALRNAGLNVDLAPVSDIGRPGSVIELQRRSFGHRPLAVAARASSFMEGLHEQGVAATAKHFPGFGAATSTTDRGPVTIDLTASELRRLDLEPFYELTTQGVDLIMLSTAVYPALDTQPATLSRRIATMMLRHVIGFSGVSISDDLEAPAALAVAPPERLAVEAAAAGTDAVMFARTLGAGERAATALASALRAGQLPQRAFRVAAARIWKLRQALASDGEGVR